MAGDIDIVKKVRELYSLLFRIRTNFTHQLITALDIAAFKEVGKVVNETVWLQLLSYDRGIQRYNSVQVDWEESTLLQRVCVRPHIDEELDNRKHVYNGIDAVLVSEWRFDKLGSSANAALMRRSPKLPRESAPRSPRRMRHR